MNQNMGQLGNPLGKRLNGNDRFHMVITRYLANCIFKSFLEPFTVHVMSYPLSDLTAIIIFY